MSDVNQISESVYFDDPGGGEDGMELDEQNTNPDEEDPVGEDDEEDSASVDQGSDASHEPEVLLADRIFLLMKKEYRLSRNTRALWYFSHMDSIINVQNRADLSQFTGDIEVVSVMPQEPVPAEWDWDTGHLYKYKVTPSTMATFLSRQYRFVYMLDFSPSAAVSDIKKNCVLIDQMMKALRRSLEGVIRPFTIPGSQVLFTPHIFVTVIGWTPFLCPGGQAVLHQGWLVTPENLEKFMVGVAKGLHDLEDNVSRIASFVIDEIETIRLQSERIVGDLFEESVDGNPMVPSVPMAAPDTGFVNMIQTGMLALQLLPDNSSACILVVTDGVLSVPDINIMDALLNQLRSKSICLSFLEVSSSYHPHSGFGYCPYNELMAFMSLATSGAFLSRVPEILIEPSEPYIYEMNQYHEAFLAWSFRKCLEGIEVKAPVLQLDKDLWRKGRYTEIRNSYFTAVAEEGLVCKKRLELTVNTNLTSILSCRLREGYTVNTVLVMDKEVKVKLTLPWKYHTFIHYTVFSVWPVTDRPESSRCRVEVSVEGPYDIIYDIICQTNKQFTSHYRNSVIKKFYMTLQQLNQTDKLLVHINSFASNPSNYTLPDTIRNGLPLFTVAPGSANPVLYSQDINTSFVNFWRPIFSLDINIWHRWMHTHRISLLLQHDQPLSKNLLMSSSTGRYQPVLCKKAASKVSELIKSSSVFCLLENHSYISFLRNEQGQPVSFYVIKVTSKPPCLVVWVAFLGGIPGSERHQIVSELSDKLREITMKQRVTWRELPSSKIRPPIDFDEDELNESPNRSQVSSASQIPDVYACHLLSKPVEKILVRYENVPSDYTTLLGNIHGRSSSPVPGQKDPNTEKSKNASAAFLTLSRYLIHQRWIYSLQSTPCVAIPQAAVTRILNTVCRARIQEGYAFAYSSRGVQNMVMEVPMSPEGDQGEESVQQTCVIQYIIFPPHITTTCSTDSVSEDEFAQGSNKDDASTEAEGEVQIILELWTEPQGGTVESKNLSLSGKHSNEIAPNIFPRDLECVSTLVTFEHLIMMCQNPCIPSPLTDTFSCPQAYGQDFQHTSYARPPPTTSQASINVVPFAFDLLNLLPKAHQTEMIFSLFIQELTHGVPETAYPFYSPLKPIADRPNEMLFECLLKELGEITDRELDLSSHDYQKLPELISKRRSSGFHFQSTSFSPCRHSFHSSSLSSHFQKTESSSRRYPSGNSVGSSLADTHRDTYSQQDYSTSEVFPACPKWKCFLKAISPTHMVLTLIPATYEDLKCLTLSQDTIDGVHPDIVDVIQKALPTECKDLGGNLDDISINSSIPNLESVSSEISDMKSPRFESVQTTSRQRSGSDVFEMNRPKLPTVRKSSGEPAIMRDRTVSLDGLSQFRAKALLRKKKKEMQTSKDRDRTDSSETRKSGHDSGETKRSRFSGSGYKEEVSSDSIQPPSPVISLCTKKVVGSVALPIYIYDCNILGLTNGLIFKEQSDKPKNHHLNYLFKPEAKQQGNSSTYCSDWSQGKKTPEPGMSLINENTEHTTHNDKDVKNWYQVIKMIYFKSFVSVLFRSLQLKLQIHCYDIQHAVDYCDNETSCDLELESFVKAVCPHQTVKRKGERDVIDVEAIKSAVSCFKHESWHKSVQKKFYDIVGNKFKVVPGLADIFFFCPPGLDFGDMIRMGSRRQDETKSSESTSRRHNSDRQREEDEDKTIEFRSDASQQSLKLNKHGSITETEIETGQRDIQSSLSSVSHLEQEWDSDDEDMDRDADEFSPPLFIQFSFSISQGKEDIVSVPVNYLPSCLCEILQDKSIPDPEQELLLQSLRLRIDIVCMTLPSEVRNIQGNIGGLRSTSLCSTMSCRDSRTVIDDDIDLEGIHEDEIGSHADVLSHLPTYQHKAVIDIKEELNWMLMDEIAFALSRTSPLSYKTLDFVSKHVQASSRERPGSLMETIELEFVFGCEKSLVKFRELFGKVTVHGYMLKQEEEFYYLDRAPLPAPEEFASTTKRKSLRLSRQIQLSPVKEALIQTSEDGGRMQWEGENSLDVTDSCDFVNIDLDLKLFEKGTSFYDWNLILRIEQERILMFVHYRDQNEAALSSWRTIQTELKSLIKDICVKVNQDLLLNDLNDSRRCNRLLEPETNEDAWRESGRQGGFDYDDFNDAPYLEANMNMSWAPGRFQCPEVWKTMFILHPRLKQGHSHGSQSWGMQAIKTVLVPYMVSNRADMFVYMDDNKNIFYIKVFEQVHSSFNHSILSRQASIISKEEEAFSRTSSVGSSKQLKKSSSEVKEEYLAPNTSRSNSFSEPERNKTEDQIIFKVYGIDEVGNNIKEDLTAVLQKKLDDKVVEVISMMLKRNSRCKLASEDVNFLQRPNSPPTKTLRYAVHMKTMPYLMAVMYYLRQNLVQIPSLLRPNYTAGTTRKFRDFGLGDDPLHPAMSATDSDVFIYNDHNEKGGRNGIACLALSLVDGKGNLVRHCSHPVPLRSESNGHLDLDSLQEIVDQIQLYNEVEGAKCPGPMALIQFRAWESGRVDMDRLSSFLENAIKHSMWDTVIEFRVLPEPLCYGGEDQRGEPAPDPTSCSPQYPNRQTEAERQDKGVEKLTLKRLSEDAILAYGYKAPLPSIVVEGKEASEVLDQDVPDLQPSRSECGDTGNLSLVFTQTIWPWFRLGKLLEVPAYHFHEVKVVAKHEMNILLQEICSLIREAVPSMDVKLFEESSKEDGKERTFVPGLSKSSAHKEYLIIGRDIVSWKNLSQRKHASKKTFAKHLQNFPSLVLSTGVGDEKGTLSVSSAQPATPSTPLTPGACSSPSHVTSGGFLALQHGSTEIFIPRQTLVIAKVTRDQMTFHFYNLTRDCVDRLVSQSSGLGQWYTARSSLLTSVVTQKIGLFHNQAFLREENKSRSRYIGDVTQVENLVKHQSPKDSTPTKTKVDVSDFQFVYRNAKLGSPPKQEGRTDDSLLQSSGKQILNIWSSDNKQYRQMLYVLWDSRGENCNVHYTEDLIRYFKQKARMLHYVFTPLLFLPDWRRKANETRDNGLDQAAQQDEEPAKSVNPTVEKHRHNSGGSVPKDRVKRSKSVTSQSFMSSPSGKSPLASPKTIRVCPDERYHSEIVSNYIQEYEQYLQTIGFTLLSIRPSQARRQGAKASVDNSSDPRAPRRRPTTGSRSRPKVVYLQKSLRGGLLIFEIGISEPFFYTRLHALEAKRLNPQSKHGMNSKNFTTTFLEECDNIKILIHLHSFTYDYHLRTISGYIGQKPSQLRKGFHVVSFLEDFMKYYSKGPNFARNFVYTDSLHIMSECVSPSLLYNYLLSHEKQYNMDVIRMEPVFIEPDAEFANEYVLVQVSNHKVSYRDHQDAKRVDEFDVSLIISYDSCPNVLVDSQKNVLSLKYFVLMTSKRDLLPMLEVEEKLGNFRAVVSSTVTQNLLKLSAPANPANGPFIPRAPTPPLIQAYIPSESETDLLAVKEDKEDKDGEVGVPMKSQLLSKLTGIRRESVNYVGYYSAHEETMKIVIQSQAKMAEEKITLVVRDAMVDCRRDHLWQRLITNSPPLTFTEFVHLTTLVHSETLDELDPRLTPLLNKSTSWYNSLSKLVATKYGSSCRQFTSLDGQIQHSAIFTEGFMGTFALVSVDFSTKEGCLAIVYREPQHTTQSGLISINSKVIQDFVEFCCFHLWTQLL